MKIVVTGGSGKVGSYVVKELRGTGHEVSVFDRVRPTIEDVRWIRGEIDNFGDVIAALGGADAVIHLAAYPIPYREVPNHVLFRNNVTGTFNVHESARCLGIKRVVSTSSVGALGYPYWDRVPVPNYFPIDEAHPTLPQDPYGIGKLCDEQIARSFALKCDMETLVFRPDRVLFPERCADLRQQGGMHPKRFDLCGYTEPRDLAAAYRQAVELPNLKHDIFFLVADDSTCTEPLSEVLPRLLPELGDKAKSLTGNKASVSNDKAKKILNWQPRYSWRKEG